MLATRGGAGRGPPGSAAFDLCSPSCGSLAPNRAGCRELCPTGSRIGSGTYWQQVAPGLGAWGFKGFYVAPPGSPFPSPTPPRRSGAEAALIPAAGAPVQSPSRPRREGEPRGRTGQGGRPQRCRKCAHAPPTCARPARYLVEGRVPLAVGRGGVGGLEALPRLPRPLGLAPGPDAPEVCQLRPQEGHGDGPSPAHGGRRLRTSAAQRPGALMGTRPQGAPGRRRGM